MSKGRSIDQWKWSRCGGKWLCPVLKNCFGIFLERMGKSLENFSHSNLFAEHDQIWNLSNRDQEGYQLDNSLYWLTNLLETCLYKCSHILTQLTSTLMTKAVYPSREECSVAEQKINNVFPMLVPWFHHYFLTVRKSSR